MEQRVSSVLRQLQGINPPKGNASAAAGSAGPPLPRTARSMLRELEEADTPTAKCRPWSREDFDGRVSTFTLSKWFGKPPAASPLECARHGWSLDDRDRLRCPSCDARLSYRIAAKPGTEAYKAALQHFVDRLMSAHADYCGWREEACSPDYAAVDTSGVHAPIAALEQRIRGLLSAGPLPPLAAAARDALAAEAPSDRLQRVAERLCEQSVTPSSGAKRRRLHSGHASAAPEPPTGDAAICALALGVSGWTAAEGTLHCSRCGRKLRLPAADAASEATAVDPIASHRTFCPWRAPPLSARHARRAMLSIAASAFEFRASEEDRAASARGASGGEGTGADSDPAWRVLLRSAVAAAGADPPASE